MKGITNLKSPLEYNFEGISEIKDANLNEDDFHHFPLTTKFITSEKTRSRHPTLQSKLNEEDIQNIQQNCEFNSDTSINKAKKELNELFRESRDNKYNIDNMKKTTETNVKTAVTEYKVVINNYKGYG